MPENILEKQSPRNRRIAEALARCGLVERAGQGADRMFEESIREGKPRPDFEGSDDYQVFLTLRGQIEDPRFIQFLGRVSKDIGTPFSTKDLLVLDKVYRHEKLSDGLLERARLLQERGVLEVTGRGASRKYLLSRRFHQFLGKQGTYTRKRGLDRETHKELLLKHLDHYPSASIRDFEEMLPHLNRNQIHSLLKDLKQEGRIRVIGVRKTSRWEKA